MSELKAWIARKVCDWWHSGGRVKRDPQGRINWQCDTCGRWSDSPVHSAVERAVIADELERKEDERE